MEKIYCISGLGADHRFFDKLCVKNYELVPVYWAPFDENDSIPSYACKLSKQIEDEYPVILCLSFGGMLATEIAKIRRVRKVIIVSSARTSSELAIPGAGIAHRIINSGIIPAWFLTTPNPIVINYLGAKTREEQKLLKEVIMDSDGLFIKWALRAIVNWKNNDSPENIVHIHGTNDKIINSAKVHPDYWIEGGTHIMIYNRAREVSKIIADCLAE